MNFDTGKTTVETCEYSRRSKARVAVPVAVFQHTLDDIVTKNRKNWGRNKTMETLESLFKTKANPDTLERVRDSGLATP